MISLVALALTLSAAPPGGEALGARETETATTCRTTLEKRLRELEKVTPRLRAKRTLEIAATSCRLLPEPLRRAAAEAAPKPKKERAERLARAAKSEASEACRPIDATAPATKLAERCPLPPPMRATPELLADLDEGTYAFGVTVFAALRNAAVARDVARLWLDDLALATALEAHAARRR